ncbi:MAG: hypothetical protein KIS84_09595, partial [Dokdonella sp.]|nr:hypothetical protein [Dokdonella sp.]
LAAAEAALGADHYLAGVARFGLAGVLVEQRRDADALLEQRRAKDVLEAAFGPEHADARLARAALAEHLLRAGKPGEARGTLGEVVFPEDPATLDPRTARVHLVAQRIAAADGDCLRVVEHLPVVIAALARGGSALRPEQASAELLLASCLHAGSQPSGDAIARADALIATLPYVPRRLREDRAAMDSDRD